MNLIRTIDTGLSPCARRLPAAPLLVVSLLFGPLSSADPGTSSEQRTPAKSIHAADISGKIHTIDNVRVVTLWGDPQERGFAHGYLLAEDIVSLLDGYLRHSVADPAAFEKQARILLKVITMLPRYQKELSGMLEGIQARLGRDVQLSVMQRALNLDDLTAMVCIPELARIGCSSFAAWGSMSETGETLAGRNLDWYAIPVLDGKQIVIVNKPEGDALGWVSITWPGFIGCLTGMNSEGVTVSMHDVYTTGPSAPLPFTPRAMALREAIETARAGSAADDVQRVLRRRFTMVGNSIPIAFPWKEGMATAAAVFEYDSKVTNGFGVTQRLNDGDASVSSSNSSPKKKKTNIDSRPTDYLLCTNHYRSRGPAESCDRYGKLKKGCEKRADDHSKLDIEAGWKLLRNVACAPDSRLRTYQSVIFEPNQKRMHVALSTDGKPAAQCQPRVLSIAELLQD